MPIATASQTIGPYWHLLEDESWADLTRLGAAAAHPDRRPIVLSGVLRDGAGEPFPDACVELWQADPPATEAFPGFGRSRTDRDGRYRFRTLMPQPVPAAGAPGTNALQAPHLALAILSRGLMHALHTRVYFAGEALNEADPVLGAIAPSRRPTLIATPAGKIDGADGWSLDLRLQGGDETVFLEF